MKMSSSAASTLLNMRVTANTSVGHRKYMEDCYKIRFQRDTSLADANNNQNQHHRQQQSPPAAQQQQQSDILFSYFAIFDGHGGAQAAQYCKQHLYWSIIRQEGFWSRDDDTAVLDAIRRGFLQCHDDMWSQLPLWPRTPSGLPSTSGTTATVVFIKGSRVYVGHVGDSGLAVGVKSATKRAPGGEYYWEGRKMTRDHKPEDPIEYKRILGVGGDVQLKSGVNRVVWNRPIFNRFQSTRNLKSRSGLSTTTSNGASEKETNISKPVPLASQPSTPHELNYLRNQPDTPTERVPFLAVARSLGDLWSYSAAHNDYVVSPEPDTFCFDLDPRIHKCLILATDGLWNVVSPTECAELVRLTDRETEEMVRRGAKRRKSEGGAQPFVNPSQRLVQTAIQRCCEKLIRADNTTCITIMLDLPTEHSHSLSPPTRQHVERTMPRPVSFSHDRTLENFSRIDNGSSVFSSGIDNEASLAAMNIADDDYNSDYDEFDNDDDSTAEAMSEFGGNGGRRLTRHRRRSRSRGFKAERNGLKPASSTMLVEAHSEPDLATPGTDKRSRSLTSLRRRHWSASFTNRCSSSVFSIAAAQQPPPSTATSRTHINRPNGFEERGRSSRLPTTTSNLNRFDEEKRIGSYIKSTTSSSRDYYYQQAQSLKNNPNLMNHVRGAAESNKSRHHRSNLNLSQSVCSFMSSSSKHLRKSMNNLFAASTNKFAATAATKDEESSKENKKEEEKPNTAATNAQAANSYSKRLKRLKNTLIKTKNTLFNRKQPQSQPHQSESSASQTLKRKSTSSSNLNKLNLTTAQSRFDLELEAATNQSLVGSFRYRFIKRSRSSKLSNLNSTALATTSGHPAAETKRPKFY